MQSDGEEAETARKKLRLSKNNLKEIEAFHAMRKKYHVCIKSNLKIYATIRSGSIAVEFHTHYALILISKANMMMNHDSLNPLLSQNDPDFLPSLLSQNGPEISVTNMRSTLMSMLPPVSTLSPGVKEYYDKQLSTLTSFEEVDAVEEDGIVDEDDEDELAQQERAMTISNYANIILLILKIYATIRSGSIALGASTLDSVLDPLSGGILWYTHMSMKIVNIYRYPIGKLRLPPVGILVFFSIMATLVLLVGQSTPLEYLQKLTYMVIRHPGVNRVGIVRAYIFGVLYFVEVEIELLEDTPLKESHAIGESR